MKGDFSRNSFNSAKHYAQVLMQQGRVHLDADWNEQQAIHTYRTMAEALDTIGMTGAPKGNPGFRITPQGNNLVIGKGHYYVEGVLCENEQDVQFTNQPHLPGATLPTQTGLYLAYLEVWQRHITYLEDDQIREKALGGPDTTTRLQTIWQVRLLPTPSAPSTITCETPLSEWTTLLNEQVITAANGGTLNSRTQPVQLTQPASADPLCVLPATAGYRRLENQLYRVEIHQGGDRTTARFKWSRDNGTVASRILSQQAIPTGGTDIVVEGIGKDDFLSFATDPLPEWVELIDDSLELSQQGGTLARVRQVNSDQRQVILESATQPLAGQNRLLRRWDQRGTTATANGVAITGNWQPLEDGIEVRFANGRYKAGDYWLIPARTAISEETGQIEWPAPLEKLPHGTSHRFVRLALLRRDAGGFSLIPDSTQGDCRKIFPALTTLEAKDISFNNTSCRLGPFGSAPAQMDLQQALNLLCQRGSSICNLLVRPTDDLATVLGTLSDRQDAHICFQAGTYQLTKRVSLQNKGHLKITGSGKGTRILAAGIEGAIEFVNCQSVSISHCYLENSGIQANFTGFANNSENLNGLLNFINCPSVEIEHLSLRCAHQVVRSSSCLTVRYDSLTVSNQVRIRDCDLQVGYQQVGILLINVDKSHLEANQIQVDNANEAAILTTLSSIETYKLRLMPRLVANAYLGSAEPKGNGATSTRYRECNVPNLTFANQSIRFKTDTALKDQWQLLVNNRNPSVSDRLGLLNVVKQFAREILLDDGVRAGLPSFNNWYQGINRQSRVVSSQGIAVVGSRAQEVRILNNTIQGFLQGIHIGISPRQSRRAGSVLITGNRIEVLAPIDQIRERHGVYVSSCESLIIENNYLNAAIRGENITIEGIRVSGRLGRMVIIRQNQLTNFSPTGVYFNPLDSYGTVSQQWLVSDNIAINAQSFMRMVSNRPGTEGQQIVAKVRSSYNFQ